jgi:hypothetical protein
MANQPVIDPWALNSDGTPDPFNNVDFSATHLDEINPDLLDEHPLITPEIVTNYPQPEPEIVVPVVEPEPEGPEVFQLEDGAYVTRTKEKGQWKAVLDPGTGAKPEVFWGKNKDELLINVLTGKLNATKKIRELSGKLKFGTPAPAQPATPKMATTTRKLTADEVFEIKTMWESDPSAAFDALMQKTRGVTMDEVFSLAQKGANADANLETGAVGEEFVRRNPDYYPDREGKNFNLIVRWLSKFKLGKPDANMFDLHSAGQWTVSNIEEAFADLSSDGLLLTAPRSRQIPPEPQAEPTPPVAVPSNGPALPAPRPNERIVQVVTRPRAALGIGRNDVTPVAPPETLTAPSAEDLNNMSDEAHQALWRATQMHIAKSRRSI